MEFSKEFHDLLFEMSNENRYRILLIIKEEKKRITDLTRQTNLTTTEVRRHVTRLSEVGLIQRDIEGYYRVTPYGETCVFLLQEIDFLSTNKEYFKAHNPQLVPTQFLKQIGKLRNATKISNPVEYFRLTQNLLKEANTHVWIIVDQFPMNLLTSLVETIDRGVKIKIIEPRERVLEPDLDALTSEESQAYNRTRSTPLYEQRMNDDIPIQLYLSESNSIISFPRSDAAYDYTGITSTDESALNWCNDLFDHVWAQSSVRALVPTVSASIWSKTRVLEDTVILEGLNNPNIDPQNIQNAVNNYREVVLDGKFNLGSSQINVNKSVKIRGENRIDDVPQTEIYKKGWSFPFHQFTGIFQICGDNVDVSIENLHFSDFNCASVFTGGVAGSGICNSLKVLNNRITINSGFGRGISGAAFGDFLHGVLIEGVGNGGVLVEGNYIDLAHGSFFRGALSRGGLGDDPEYRPDLFNHEYYVGFGIAVNGCSGKVEILNNIVKNASGRGIATGTHSEQCDVIIRGNVVESDVYGSYPMSSRESGAGILATVGLGDKDLPGFSLCIENNTVRLEKLNHSGILVLGPVTEGSSKLRGGVIRGNSIELRDGYEGIHVRKCDEFLVTGNKISGEAYYGIHLSGHRVFSNMDMSSNQNQFNENNLQGLKIKEPDDYVLNHLDGKTFTEREPRTSYFWLDKYTKNNQVTLPAAYSIIDEGENNIVRKNESHPPSFVCHC